MSLNFYIEDEDNNKEESVDKYRNLFLEYWDNCPTLTEALNQLFKSTKIDDNKINELTKDILDKCKKTIDNNYDKIKDKYNNITKDDAYIICSYTCESKEDEYNPYIILNKNLVSDNRQKGLENISKYLYILLKSLRKLPKCYPNQTSKYLYRCIRHKVNLSKDPFNNKLIPYEIGNKKTFWGFTSTSPNPKIANKFLKDEGLTKAGTIFSLGGNIWGYDIELFNHYGEKEILLEPERKFVVDNIIPEINEIIYVTCILLDSPLILNFDKIFFEKIVINQKKIIPPKLRYYYSDDYLFNGIIKVFRKIWLDGYSIFRIFNNITDIKEKFLIILFIILKITKIKMK